MVKKKTRRISSSVKPQIAPPSERERGAQAFAKTDYDSAITAWMTALRHSPSAAIASALAEAHFRRACKTLRKSLPQALDDLKAACALAPEDPVYLYHRALTHHRLGDLPAALESYRESLRHDPFQYGRTAFHLCLALAESGRDPTADSTWELLTPEQKKLLQSNDGTYIAALDHLSKGSFEAAEPLLQKVNPTSKGLSHYYLGVTAWRRGQMVESLAHWLSALKVGYDTPALHHNLAAAYTVRAIAQINSPTLLDMVRAALKISPDVPILLKLKQHAEFLEGNRAAGTGDWHKALIHWSAAARRDPKQPGPIPRELLSNLALAYERLERWSEAAETWRELIRRRPRRGENAWSKEDVGQLWKHIDLLYARTGYLAKSVDVLRYAIKAQPDDLTLRLALVRRHMENQNWRSAKSIVLGILELEPKHSEASALYAQILDMNGDLDLMIDAWEQVTTLGDPHHVALAKRRLMTLYAERGIFYFGVNDTESGTLDYERALAIAPDDPGLRLRYGVTLIPSDPEKARLQFEGVDLNDDTAAFAIISAWHRIGDHVEAARWLNRRAARKGLGPMLLVELGADLFDKHPEVASAYFAQALDHASKDDPESPRLLTMIAVIFAAHDQLTEAYDYARRALKLDPDFGPAQFNIGLWDAAKGRRQAAIRNWEKAQQWAWKLHRNDIFDGIEEAIHLLEERYVPTLGDILDTIDPDGDDESTRRLMGNLPGIGKG